MLIGWYGESSMEKKILMMAGYYTPSIKGGGPIQSIKNLVDNLSERLTFYIIAADRDLGDNRPFNGIKFDDWVSVGRANVYYTNYSELTWKKTEEIINSIEYDVIYLNSFFSYKDSIVPIMLSKLNRIPRRPIVIAPRGQFSQGALGLKGKKKNLYIKLTKSIGLYKNTIWHATGETEEQDIIRTFGENTKIKVANNLTANYKNHEYNKNIKKNSGELKVIFISRVHPKKNLKMAISLLKRISGKVEFNIYGPIEDKNYWSKCQELINNLPDNISVAYKGIVEHDNIMDIFKEHHVFLFPTLGENFGHVISESLIGGCPVIISDQTPWRELKEIKAGWDIPLTEVNKYIEALNYCVNLSEEQYFELSQSAYSYGKKVSNLDMDIENSYRLFME